MCYCKPTLGCAPYLFWRGVWARAGVQSKLTWENGGPAAPINVCAVIQWKTTNEVRLRTICSVEEIWRGRLKGWTYMSRAWDNVTLKPLRWDSFRELFQRKARLLQISNGQLGMYDNYLPTRPEVSGAVRTITFKHKSERNMKLYWQIELYRVSALLAASLEPLHLSLKDGPNNVDSRLA